jgi:repressor LexA
MPTVDSEPLQPLTKMQLRILGAVKAHIAQKGYPPSIGELGKMVGRARATVAYHLHQLELMRRIERDPRVTRGIRVLEER